MTDKEKNNNAVKSITKLLSDIADDYFPYERETLLNHIECVLTDIKEELKTTNVKRLINDGNAELIERLSELYEAGEVKGIVIGVSLNNGEFITMDSGTLEYLESLGLATSIVHGLQYELEEAGE